MNLRANPAGVALALLAVGCGGHDARSPVAAPSPSPSPSVSTSASDDTSTAEGTVVAYYHRLGRHDIAGAAQLLEPGMRREYLAAGPDGEFMNTVSVSHIRDLGAALAHFPPAVPAGYRDITQVFLTYDAVYRHVVAADNGPNSRFVYVGRNASGRWLIVEIGTGP